MSSEAVLIGGRSWEPVRLASVDGLFDQIELDGAVRDVVVRPFNFAVATPLREDLEDGIVLSLIAIKSHPSTKDTAPVCEMLFRVWSDVPSAAFTLVDLLVKDKNALVVTHYPPASKSNIEELQPCRRIRVLFDEIEVAPFDLDMRDNYMQATERLLLKNARYEMVEDA